MKKWFIWGIVTSIILTLIDQLINIFYSGLSLFEFPLSSIITFALGFIFGIILNVLFGKEMNIWKGNQKDLFKAIKSFLIVFLIQISSFLSFEIIMRTHADNPFPAILSLVQLPFMPFWIVFNQILSIHIILTILAYALVLFGICFLGIKILKKIEHRKILYLILLIVIITIPIILISIGLIFLIQ